ncbi:acyl-CoA dehydrogenase family protein [Solwaraspora sp. WMMD1047]|uniref:acyl-CoA dehydrogenase family protein n=1 Tax=Solwaraspora sp. WMMD1047 TaxID=3016102 RepID=UPI00241653AD|nr:acyl-CoA dehydrogenase family protein [Solwaraspora sp. WMMD1047]MDG4830661.1 acyl-CoA dehydrogenase family protein [Solwaraspora sp. WMMD1047]
MTGGLAGYRDLGRDHGLAAGLAAVLDGLDPVVVAPQRVAVLPADELPAGAQVLPHPLAARDGLALVRFPAAAGRDRTSGTGLRGRPALALAAVRIGVLSGLLHLAVQRLAGRAFRGVPLIDQQLVVGAVADVVAELEFSAAALDDSAGPSAGEGGDPRPSVEVAAGWHERLTEAGWNVSRLLGAEGYLATHPARSLFVSALVADVWLPRPTVAGG